ncbi:MAG: hypothetical protein HRT57_15450 [Crocinitomicaceae bacterium]|nr:hypothetical protein [Crocinitomicaceae bacterium]
MKHLILITTLIVLGAFQADAQVTPVVTPPPNPRKVQVAILFDTSGSMDGLIDQAKSRIWNIVNEISTLQYEGQSPSLEFALYRYGNDGLSSTTNYIEQLLDLTSNMDIISQKLFALTTNGGSEYCGAVIGRSLSDLNWSISPTDLKMIYIAGNERFDQGSVDFKAECKKAKDRGIFINTIHCGSYEKGVIDLWKEGAECSGGDYFNINSDAEIVHIPTPYDDKIQSYNDSLNSTYYGYGSYGSAGLSSQSFEDGNAIMSSPQVATERAIVKSKSHVYDNSSWDIVDAQKSGTINIEELKEEELPEEFKGKTSQEKKILVAEKQEEREAFQAKIGELAVEREAFITAEKDKRAKEGEEVDDFGSSINKSIMEKATSIGFQKETP